MKWHVVHIRRTGPPSSVIEHDRKHALRMIKTIHIVSPFLDSHLLHHFGIWRSRHLRTATSCVPSTLCPTQSSNFPAPQETPPPDSLLALWWQGLFLEKRKHKTTKKAPPHGSLQYQPSPNFGVSIFLVKTMKPLLLGDCLPRTIEPCHEQKQNKIDRFDCSKS